VKHWQLRDKIFCDDDLNEFYDDKSPEISYLSFCMSYLTRLKGKTDCPSDYEIAVITPLQTGVCYFEEARYDQFLH
jgi:hypothetical protein